jgi:hypothetical protein
VENIFCKKLFAQKIKKRAKKIKYFSQNPRETFSHKKITPGGRDFFKHESSDAFVR